MGGAPDGAARSVSPPFRMRRAFRIRRCAGRRRAPRKRYNSFCCFRGKISVAAWILANVVTLRNIRLSEVTGNPYFVLRFSSVARPRGQEDSHEREGGVPNPAVSRSRKFEFFAHRAVYGVLPRFIPVILHHLRLRIQKVCLGLLHGFAFGKNLWQFSKWQV